MKKLLASLLLLAAFIPFAQAQKDPQAENILEAMSK